MPFVAVGLLVAIGFPARSAGEKTNKSKPKREIAITFDELPAAKGFVEADRAAITFLILQALERHEVKAAGFVVGETIEDSFDILGKWLNAGHLIGNLTFSYQDFSQLSPQNYIADIEAGNEVLETMLAGFGQKGRYFRYPYLHYGIDPVSRREVENFLEARGCRPVHATVVVEDYLYNLSLEKMGKVPDSSDYDILMNDYLNHVIDEIERSERLALSVLNRPCRQILQLRANRLNAVFLDELLTALEGMGFEFVSLTKALKDKVYRMPQAYYGLKGIGFLDMIRESDPDKMPAR